MKSGPGTVSVIGMGYVGLCTAAAFASRGFKTVGIDIDEKRIEQIQQGRAPLYEPQLEGMLRSAVRKKPHLARTNPAQTADTSSTFLTEAPPTRKDASITLPTTKQARLK